MGCGVSCSSARCYRVPVKNHAIQHSSSAVPDERAAAIDLQNSEEDVRAEAAHVPAGMGLAQAPGDQRDAGAADTPRTATATTSCGASSAAHTISDDGSHGSPPFREEADQLEISVAVRADAAMELARRGDGVPEVTLEEWTTSTPSHDARSAEDSRSAVASSFGDDQASVGAMSGNRVVRRTVSKPLPRHACAEGLAGSAYKHPCRKLHPVPWAMNASTDGEALSDGDLQADMSPKQAITQISLTMLRDAAPNESALRMLPISEGPACAKRPTLEALEADHPPQKESASADEAQVAEIQELKVKAAQALLKSAQAQQAQPRRPCVPAKWPKSEEGGLPWCQSPRKRRPMTAVHRRPFISTDHESSKGSGDDAGSVSGSVSVSDSSSPSPVARETSTLQPPPPPPSPSPVPPPPPPPRCHAVREDVAPHSAEEISGGARLPRLASIPSQPLGASGSAEQLITSGLSGIPPLPASRTCCAHEPEVSAGTALARSSSASSMPAFTDMPLPPEGYEGQIAHHTDGRSLLQRLDPGLPSEGMQRAVAAILAQRQEQSGAQQATGNASSGAASTPGLRPLRPLPSGYGEWSADEAGQNNETWHGYVESRKAVPLSALPPLSPASVAPYPQESKAEETKAEMTRKAAAALANSKAAETFGHVSSRHLARNGMVLASTSADASLHYPWQSSSNVYAMSPGIAGAAAAPPLPVLPGMPSGNPHTLPWMPSPLSGLPGMPPMLGVSSLPAPGFLNQAPQACLALPMLYNPDVRMESKDVENSRELVQLASPLPGPPGPVRFHSPDAAAGRSPDAAAAAGNSQDAAKANGGGRWSHSGRWKDILYDLRGTHGVTPF